LGALSEELRGAAVMHVDGRVVADAGMPMLVLVPMEEVLVERAGRLQGGEAVREVRRYLSV